MNKNNSPYTAALTGGGFLFEETLTLLPLLQAENSEELLQEEKVNNNLLHINAETARSRNIHEIKRRYQTMPPSFWNDFKEMSDSDKIIALFYVMLKTYKILRKVGMLTNDNRLHSLVCTNYDYYLAKGEPWFLEACLLQPYEIDNIKKSM